MEIIKYYMSINKRMHGFMIAQKCYFKTDI